MVTPADLRRPLTRAQQRDQILLTCRTLLEPGQVTEVRTLRVQRSRGYPRNHSGYFDDWDRLAKAVMDLKSNDGVYLTPNPVDPACLARAANRIKALEQGDPTTSDANIQFRRWLLVDLDPVRPSKVSSTDEELAAGLELARQITTDLKKNGWPTPIVAASGNGLHLLWRVDLSATDGGVVQRTLQALHRRYTTETVAVDLTTHNPARIWRLYGTITTKGDDLQERPHRYSRILVVPDPAAEVVTLEQLQELAGESEPAPEPRRAAGDSLAELAAVLAGELGLEPKGPGPWQGGRKWTLGVCPWDPGHTGHSAYLIEQPGGAVAAGCHHNSCAGRKWKDLKDQLRERCQQVGSEVPAFLQARRRKSGRWRARSSEKDPPSAIAEAFLKENHVFFAFGTLWHYRDGCYHPDGDLLARRFAIEYLGHAHRKNDGNEVVYYLSVEGAVLEDEVNQSPLINVQNGLLDPHTKELFTHSHEVLSTIQLPVRWDPDAYHARGDQFLDQTLPSREARLLFEELVGDCLHPGCEHEKTGLLSGGGNNGKSVALNWVSGTLGKKNVSSVSLQEIAQNRFKAAEIFGKLANICADLPRAALQDTDIFKRLVTGDEISAERKHRDPFKFRNRATLIFSANRLPHCSDRTDGFFRRWLIIPFPNKFKGDARDPNLTKKLLTAEGRSYLLRLAVEGLRRLKARGEFQDTPETREAMAEYQRQLDPVLRFIGEFCRFGPDYKIRKSELYDGYQRWVEVCNIKLVSQSEFGRRLRGYEWDITEERPAEDGYRVRYWVGVDIDDEALLPRRSEPLNGADSPARWL